MGPIRAQSNANILICPWSTHVDFTVSKRCQNRSFFCSQQLLYPQKQLPRVDALNPKGTQPLTETEHGAS